MEQKPKLEAVTKAANAKKNPVKGLGKKIFAEGATSVGSHVVDDVVIPKTQELLSQAAKYAIDFIFFGNKGANRNTGSVSYRGNSYVNYNNISNITYRTNSKSQSEPKQGDVMSCNEVGLPDRGSAEVVILRMKEWLNRYGDVEVAKFYELVGITPNHTAYNYGWYSLDDIGEPQLKSDGYWYIPFPKIQSLK